MPTTFFQLWNNVIAEVGSDLPTPRAKQIVNQAWREVLNKRPWSFLLRESVIIAPAAITGDITFTQYSRDCVPSVALKATLDALASPPPITRRSLRLNANNGVTSPTAPIYDIYAYDPAGAGTITLNRAYQEDSDTAEVMIFRRWYLPPYDESGNETTDFMRWLTVKDPDNDWWLDLTKAKRWIDSVDPNRTYGSSAPFVLCEGPAATTQYPGVSFDGNLQPGAPLYELYPYYNGSAQKTYQCVYQAYGKELTDDFGSVNSVLPPYIDDELVFDKARALAYRWAEINKGKIPSLQKTNWLLLMNEAEESFQKQYLAARRVDDEHYKQWWLPKMSIPYGKYPMPFGADYFQSHQWGPWWSPI
jgi:hypothetical protein